jgi:hypothetical protein
MESMALPRMPPFSGKTVRVESYCACCLEPVGIDLRDADLLSRSPEGVRIHVSLSPREWNKVNIVPMCDSGGGGSDTLVGGPGEDFLDGGFDDDTIYADVESTSPTPTTEPESDTIRGGGGADVIYAEDGVRDHIDCGDGLDTAFLDVVDLETGCETIFIQQRSPTRSVPERGQTGKKCRNVPVRRGRELLAS